MKRVLILLVLLLLTVQPACVWAADLCLIDNASLLSEQDAAAVSSELENVGSRLSMDIVVLTVESLDGSTARHYAENYYDDHGYGDTGVLLLVCMAEREWYICTTGDIYVDSEELGNQFTPMLSSGDYADAFLTFAYDLEHYMSYRSGPEKNPVKTVVICLVIGIVVGLLVVLILKAQLRSVRSQKTANYYLLRDSFHLTHSRDMYLYRNVIRRAKPKSSSSSSSGRSHGGGGGSF